MRWNRVLSGAVLIALGACSPRNTEPAPIDIASVKAHYAKWNRLVAVGDIASAADLLAPDIWASVPNAPPIIGRDAAVAAMKTWPKVEQSADIEEVGGGGDLVYTRARYTEHVTGPDGKVVTDHVMCLDILQKTSTGWQFKRYSCHSIEPLPQGGK